LKRGRDSNKTKKEHHGSEKIFSNKNKNKGSTLKGEHNRIWQSINHLFRQF
jgi:hypothetical protein